MPNGAAEYRRSPVSDDRGDIPTAGLPQDIRHSDAAAPKSQRSSFSTEIIVPPQDGRYGIMRVLGHLKRLIKSRSRHDCRLLKGRDCGVRIRIPQSLRRLVRTTILTLQRAMKSA